METAPLTAFSLNKPIGFEAEQPMLLDRFDREIDYLRISVTDRCNLRCLYCAPDAGRSLFAPEQMLTADEIVRIAGVAMGFGLRQIRLTGGEPLVRPDLLDIVAGIKALGIRDLSLTTNGQLLAGMARDLKAAGLDRVNISLDSLKPDRFKEMTGGGDLERTLAGIDGAESAGLVPVKINMVPIRGVNDDEIPAFARLTLMDKREPWHIRFIELMPTGRSSVKDRSLCVRTAEIMERVSTIGSLGQLEFRGKGPSRNYRIRGARGIVGFISAMSHSFCYECSRLRMNAIGRLRPCLFSKTEIDLGGPLRQGADDTELARLFALAVEAKPEGDYLKSPETASLPTMPSIGG